jgi:hypothetical protein
MNSLVPVVCAVAFPFLWLSLSLVLSHLGGWAHLAARYRDHRREPGATYYFRTGAVGAVNYRWCLVLRVCETGLRMSVWFPFRIGHPQLFIPWGEFHSAEVTRLLFIPFIEAYVGLPVVATVRLPIWLRSHLLPASWRGAEPSDAAES